MGELNANVISRKPCEHTGKLLQETRLHGFTQVLKKPTRVTEHASPATDFIFVYFRLFSYGVQEFGARDHSVKLFLPLRKVAHFCSPMLNGSKR